MTDRTKYMVAGAAAVTVLGEVLCVVLRWVERRWLPPGEFTE